MKRIESVDIDVERFEANLRGAMESAEDRVIDDFTAFSNQQMEEQAGFKETLRKTVKELTDGLAGLEKELDALKETAVSNTVNRLSDFEKTYYADLSKRTDELAELLAQSKNDFASQLTKFDSDSEEKRRHMEAEYSEGLKAGIAALQDRTKEQFAHYEAASQKSEAALQDQVAVFEQATRESIEQSKVKLSALVDSSGSLLKTELDRHTASFNEQLSHFEHEIRQKIDGITEEVDANQTTSKAAIDEVISDFSLWKERINGQFDESKKLFAAQLETLDQNAAEMIDRVKETIESDVEEYSGMAKKELNDAQSKYNEMVLKLQTASVDLDKTFDDLEKRLKNVIAQSESSVFDKAEERQNRLDTAVVTLKNDLAQIEAFRPLIAELKQEYMKMQDMERDASGKLSKMSGEKKRIESLETNFNQLMAISMVIDEKKEMFTTQQDDIQNFQSKLRNFNDDLNAVASRFDRLDKKGIDLDRTIADVDRTFAKLAELEKQLRDCEQKTNALPAQLEALMQDVGRVAGSRDRINDAIKKLDMVEKELGTTENKMEEVTKSRDIITRSQMRLESLVQEADSLIKLFAAVKTTDTKPTAPESSGLTVNKREQVIQLAHMGWKAVQIAERLILSITEVDLLLQIPQ
jgi:DNA repair exonuclease SbcCD ATPase subunit